MIKTTETPWLAIGQGTTGSIRSLSITTDANAFNVSARSSNLAGDLAVMHAAPEMYAQIEYWFRRLDDALNADGGATATLVMDSEDARQIAALAGLIGRINKMHLSLGGLDSD